MYHSSNPVLNDKLFEGVRAVPGSDIMTLAGTTNKSLISVALLFASGWYTMSTPGLWGLTMPAIILGLVLAVALAFKQNLAPYLAPAYALVQGVVLGSISAMYASQFEGVVTQAIMLTALTAFCMLTGYRSGIIPMNDKIKAAVAAATMGIFAFYLIAMVAGLFGANLSFMASSSPLSIGISVLVTGLAAFNLVVDFYVIENIAKSGNAPKYMEWYGAFTITVTLVWLYLEMLRLLSKLQSRN